MFLVNFPAQLYKKLKENEIEILSELPSSFSFKEDFYYGGKGAGIDESLCLDKIIEHFICKMKGISKIYFCINNDRVLENFINVEHFFLKFQYYNDSLNLSDEPTNHQIKISFIAIRG